MVGTGFQRRRGQHAFPYQIERRESSNRNTNPHGLEAHLEIPAYSSTWTSVSAGLPPNPSLHEGSAEKTSSRWWRGGEKAREKEPSPKPREGQRPISAEENANFLSKLTFGWISKLLYQGYQKPLQAKDVPVLNGARHAHAQGDLIVSAFKANTKRGDKYPLFWALYEYHKTKFWIAGICRFLSDILLVCIPYTLRYLIQFAIDSYIANLRGEIGPPVNRGIGLLVGIVIMQILQSFILQHHVYLATTIGGQSRAVLIKAIFDKSVRYLGRGKAPPIEGVPEDPTKKLKGVKDKGLSEEDGYTTARVTALLTVDSSRVDHAPAALHILWTAPLALTMTFALLIVNMQTSALAGFGLMVLGFLILIGTVGVLFKQRRVIDRLTDSRVSMIQEVLSSIRLAKYFGWDEQFADRIEAIRNQEARGLHRYLVGRNIVTSLSASLPFLTAMISFVTYALTHDGLSPAIVFSSTALFNTLRMPLSFLPVCIQATFDSWSALSRIQEYLLTEEMEDYPLRPSLVPAVEIRQADFTWDHRNPDKKEIKDDESIAYSLPVSENLKSTFSLLNVNLSIKRGELLAVIGGIGSGKTSLLSAIAGDMRKTSGSVVWGSSMAVCHQNPWIQNTTVRENILFGLPFEQRWYRTVIQACSLARDLDILTNGDATIVGERGSILSGGQKQRISLARAMYSRSDLVLLDDPLSAVDANVGRKIMDEALCGQMTYRTRVMATHHLHLLPRADRIVWLDQGEIRAIDTYANLIARDAEFARMMEESRGSQSKLQPTSIDDKRLSVKRNSAVMNRRSVIDNRNSWVVPDWMHNTEDDGHQEDKLMQDEDQESHAVTWRVYASFLASNSSTFLVVACFPFLIAAQGCSLMTAQWLAWWSSNRFDLPRSIYIGVYASLAIGAFVFLYIFSVLVATCCISSSRTMMNKAIRRVIRAPVAYFDTTPLGRLLNRFSKDVETMDFSLTEATRLYLHSLAGILGIFTMIIVYFQWSAIAIGVLLGLLVVLGHYYRRSAREVKRHEAVFRSTAFARFIEGLTGVPTIRSYKTHDTFSETLCHSIDDMNSATFLSSAIQRWLNLRLDLLGVAFLLVMGIFVIVDRDTRNPSTSGLVMSLTINAIQVLQVVVREWADVENAMNSTERIYSYAHSVPQESDITTELTQAEPAPFSWPRDGEITFSSARMRYRPGLPEALKGLNMTIHGGERMAIVGRTGAGKSSIVNALFRLTELSGGHIEIDGQDISRLRLQDLRSKLSIIPQDTTLFSGTVRTNLDPFDTLSDAELWGAIRTAGLQDALHLSDVVEDEGANLSLGQKQLLALARVLVRQNRIVICDEATAALDPETDERIQKTMRTAFADKTVIYIAHRLRSVLTFDRICVMDHGQVAELGTPMELFEKKGGIFRDMCIRDGITKELVILAAKIVKEQPSRTFIQPFGEPFEQSFEQFFAQWF
ncbi:P-loop containing nucleoside triphosphate hydrolase protein [Xylariaceae sp. FL0016]|nr:P-loop containing nucleoside triphosphate hydrolase protein [Xylariaceae sp. FL0016]